MFCPKCGYEYKEGIKKCSDCGEELVSAIKEKEHPDFEVVMLTKVSTEFDALTLKSMLDDMDVENITGDYTAGYKVSLDTGKAWGYVMVNRKKLELAKEVLEDFKSYRRGRAGK